jgi:3'-5' exoribonuclease
MERRFVKALAEGDRVDGNYALRTREMRATRAGEAYLTLELADRTGRIGAVLFRPVREAASLPAGCVVRVRGVVTSYRGLTRVSVEEMKAASTYDPADLLPAGTRDDGELLAELRKLVGAVKAPPLKALLRTVFGDKAFMARFKTCPGSQSHHHAYLGGLLEHTVAVATLCRSLGDLYPHANADLLLSAALLHDIGKVDELEYTVAIEYTDEGRMIGHVLLGERRVRAAIERLGNDFPAELATRLAHVMLSHHGELEWGSPKRPCTLEALVLHHADNLDAKTAGFIAAAAGAGLVEEPWTDAMNLFRRPLWAPSAVEDDRMVEPVEDAAFARSA